MDEYEGQEYEDPTERIDTTMTLQEATEYQKDILDKTAPKYEYEFSESLSIVLAAAEKAEENEEDAEKWRAVKWWLSRTPQSFITMTGADDALEALLEIILPEYRKPQEAE